MPDARAVCQWPPILAIDLNPGSPDGLIGVLSIVGILALVFGPTVVTCLLERRMVWVYTPLDGFAEGQVGPSDRIVPASGPVSSPGLADSIDDSADKRNPYRPPSSPAMRATNQARLTAEAMLANQWFRTNRFAPLGTFAHGKGGIYKVRYDFWLAPDRSTLALVGGGTMAGIPVDTTTCYSRLADGRVLITVSHQNGSENLLPRIYLEALVATLLTGELVLAHHQRLTESGVPVVPYAETQPLNDHLRMRVERADQLEALGMTRYLDLGRTAWKFTLKGAIIRSVGGILNGIRRVLLPDSVLARFRRQRAG